MNELNREKITLEWIILEKERKLQEIRQVKENIHLIAGEMLGPKQDKIRGIESVMSKLSYGLAIFDGIKMGIGIMRRFRSFFVKKR